MFDQDGNLLHHVDPDEVSRLHIGSEVLQKVLNGGVYQHIGEHKHPLLAGLPFEVDGNRYALFIAPEIEDIPFASIIRTTLILVLLIGSLIILLAARYLVRPLQLLTKATRQMAKGIFDIQVRIKSKDEIGQLANSFNLMAHELGTLEANRKQFVSDVSHEIQSPLTSIKGFTQAIRYKKMDEATKLEMLAIIEEEADRLSRLSSNLLQLSSLEQEHLKLSITVFRLDHQLRQVIVASEPQWNAKNQEIEFDANEITIHADEDKLYQLWTNLLGNAIKFTPEGGLIRITADQSSMDVRVSITDSGSGISEEEMEHIFKPFYKIDKSRDRSEGGSGIGLSIVKRIVELHDGEIGVTSRNGQLKGTMITIIFPVL
nr:HAMP domain-containing sensor histidine kinase [Cohnella mopanensis]